MTDFVRVFVEEWKTHVLPRTMFKAFLDYCNTQGTHPVLTSVADQEVVVLDNPGVIMADRTFQVVKLGDLEVKVPTIDFESMLDQLKKAPKRFDAGIEFYRVNGAYVSLVLTPAQRDQLLSIWGILLVDAKKQAAAEELELSRRIHLVNANGTKLLSSRDPALRQKVPLSGRPSGAKN